MSAEKNYQEYWRKYGWLWKRLGTGRKRYFLLSFMNVVFFNLVLVVPALLMLESISHIIKTSLVVAGSINLFLSLIVSMRLRYWRDLLVWKWIVFIPLAFELFIVGFALVGKSGDMSTLLLVGAGFLASIFLALHRSKYEAERWALAQRKGFLKRYLDEKNWVFDNDPAKMYRLGFDLAVAEKTTEQYKNSIKWLMRLEKLHFLIPGIMISFRRAFGHEEIVIGGLLIGLGLLFISAVNGIPVYLKIREWEKEKGKPILLREIWEKEQQQSR